MIFLYYCSIFQYQGQWVINDEPDNIFSTAPDYSGIVGYVCEYEDTAYSAEQETGSSVRDSSGSVGAAQTGALDYSTVYEGAFQDVETRKVNSVVSNSLFYSLFDMHGDGIKELVFWQHAGNQSNLLWIYTCSGNVWNYMGEIEDAAINPDTIYGYQNGFICQGNLKMGSQIDSVMEYYRWNGSAFENQILFSGSFTDPYDIPSVEQLGERGYYDPPLIIEKAPPFRDVSDRSLLYS